MQQTCVPKPSAVCVAIGGMTSGGAIGLWVRCARALLDRLRGRTVHSARSSPDHANGQAVLVLALQSLIVMALSQRASLTDTTPAV